MTSKYRTRFWAYYRRFYNATMVIYCRSPPLISVSTIDSLFCVKTLEFLLDNVIHTRSTIILSFLQYNIAVFFVETVLG
jgi:ribulose-5-phosphate 4-epimerase/fuculose-1-phosphate aldolase